MLERRDSLLLLLLLSGRRAGLAILNIQTRCALSLLQRHQRWPISSKSRAKAAPRAGGRLKAAAAAANKAAAPQEGERSSRRAQRGSPGSHRRSLQPLCITREQSSGSVPGKSILRGGRAGDHSEERRKKKKPTAKHQLLSLPGGRESERGMNLEDPETQRGKVAPTGDSAH